MKKNVLLICLLVSSLFCQSFGQKNWSNHIAPRMRLIIDNDFSGDPALKIKPQGKGGNYLWGLVDTLVSIAQKYNFNIGETYILGDSPLVLLTALQSSFEPDPSSSEYKIGLAPTINSRGAYEFNAAGRNIRVYSHLDIHLMFEDFFAKLELMTGKK